MQLPYNKTVLNNGITTLTRSVDSLRSVAVGVFIQAGSSDENPHNNGIAHFLEHMSFKRTKTRNAYDIVEDIESRGGHINAYTSRELTAYYARVLDSELDMALDVLCDIVRNSTYPKDEIEREKSVVIEEIRDSLDTPQDIANDAFMDQMFPKHPYGYPIMGSVETVSSFSIDTISDFIKNQYTSYRITIVAVGAIDHKKVVKQVEKHLGDYKTINHAREEFQLFDPVEKEKILSRDIAQSHLLIGRRALGYNDKRRITYAILNSILSAGMTSRLFHNIREKYGFAYTIYSFIDAFKSTGLFGVYIATDLKHVDRVKELIWKEFIKLKTESISKQELDKVKAQSKGSLVMGLESMYNQMERMVQQHIRYNKIVSIDESLKKIEAITPKDIQDLSNELFDESLYHTLLLKPNGK
ncbi:MAG: pitrilysin family protein [Candidatus Marinimicrobia bacterium]|nr:pitrilysin family protein [Candidatus Neomarinimicrobiota bacterium]